ncbi:hypothetical protein CPC08DRAFT_767726 [Agrocybe pediades]|nr:hypothetical protein CPC08DRAFT_767726 [Agrocybe pediades]
MAWTWNISQPIAHMLSATPDPFYSVAQEKKYLLAPLNMALIYFYMFGIYTGLFALTLFLYLRKKNRTISQTITLIGGLTFLYGVTLGTIIIPTWQTSSSLFVRHDATRSEMFLVSVFGDGRSMSDGVYVLETIYWFLGGSVQTVLPQEAVVLMLLLFLGLEVLPLEAGLAISLMAYKSFLQFKPQDMNVNTLTIADRLVGAFAVSTALTAVAATSIICFKIYTHMKPVLRSHRQYKTIIDILVQSSAIYSIIIVVLAVLGFVRNPDLTKKFNISVGTIYVESLSNIVIGLVPTLMVARLCMSSAQHDTEVFSSSATRSFEPCTYQSTQGSPVDPSGDDVEMQWKVAPSTDHDQEENNGIMIINRRDPTAEEDRR